MNDVNFSTLDSSLLSYINSEQRWEAFKNQFVEPLTVKKRSRLTGNVMYEGYPANCKPIDSILADTIFLGKSKHLILVSLVYHMTHVTRHVESSNYLDIASHFNTVNYYQRFSSLTKHSIIDANNESTRDNLLSLMRIWDPKIDDYINTYKLKHHFLIDTPTDHVLLYDWQMNKIDNALSIDEYNHSNWSKHFTPLRYYQWMIPESKLSTLDFYLDPNTSYMYSWLQDYLAKCRLYRVKIGQLAKAVKTRDAYKKKLDQLSQLFVERNTRISTEIRANIAKVGIPEDPNERKRAFLTRQFLQQLSTLYGKYLRQINTVTKKK